MRNWLSVTEDLRSNVKANLNDPTHQTAPAVSDPSVRDRIGRQSERDEVAILNTGTGTKRPETMPIDLPVLSADGAIPGPAR
ncbi:MAG: hypothetical protein M0030_00710 [Actinomycetota bacterium]|nr:hypothetical protein [Actinomycetota bacterium]